MNFMSNRGKNRLLSILFLLVLSFGSFEAFGGHPADPSSLLAKYSMYAEVNLTSGYGNTTSGDATSDKNSWIGTGPTGILTVNNMTINSIIKTCGNVKISDNPCKFKDTVFINGDLNNEVYYKTDFDRHVTANSFSGSGSSNYVQGYTTANPGVIEPKMPQGVNIVTTGPNVSPANGSTLPAGNYGTLTLTEGSTIYFTEGIYHFASIKFNNAGSIIVRKNLGDVTRVLVKDDINFNNQSKIKLDLTNGDKYGTVLIYFDGLKLRFDTNTPYVDATIIAPNAEALIGNGFTLNGQIFAKNILINSAFDGGLGTFIPWDPGKISLVGAASLQITENPATRFVKIPVELSAGMDTTGVSVQYSIETFTGANAAINDGVDFNNDTTIGSETATPTGTLTFNKNATEPNESIIVHIIDDILTVSDASEDQIEYFALRLFNPNLAVLDADSSAHQIVFDADSVVTELLYKIPIINDDFNDNPDAINDTITINEGETVLINVTKNDTDPNGDQLQVINITVNPVNSDTAYISSDSTITYTHNDLENTFDSLEYQIADKPAGATDIAKVYIKIIPVFDLNPISTPDNITVYEHQDTNKTNNGATSLFANDTDPEFNDTITFSKIIKDGSLGTMTIDTYGTFTYTHNSTSESVFLDTVIYEIKDKGNMLDTAFAYITVLPVNDNPPVATNGAITVNENDSSSILYSGYTTLMSLVSDLDLPYDTLTISASNAMHGTFTLNSDYTFKYVNNGKGVEYTTDTASFTVTDAVGHSATGLIIITINLINDETPIATDNTINVAVPGGVQTILANGNSSVLDDDFDLDAVDTKKATLLDSTVNGTLILESTGTFTYTHITLTNLLDSATYICEDAAGHKDTAKIFIGIALDFTTKPIAGDDYILIDEGASIQKLINDSTSLFWNDSGNDIFDKLKGFVITTPLHGTFFLDSASGTFIYEHDDSENFADTITYYVEDLAGLKDTATIYITITPVNDNLTVVNEDLITVIEGKSVDTLSTGATSVLENDTDIDGMTGVTALIAKQPLAGTVTLNPDGTFLYTHNGSEVYTDTFEYVAIDGVDTTLPTTVSIIIEPKPKPSKPIVTGYYDTDANGVVDSIRIEFDRPIILKNSSDETVTSFQLKWDSFDIVDLIIDSTNFTDSGYTMITNVAGLFPGIKTSGTMYLQTKFTLYDPNNKSFYDTTIAAMVNDKAAPVLTAAAYSYNEETIDTVSYDNLFISFSESVNEFVNNTPFIFINENFTEYSMNLEILEWNSNNTIVECRVINLFDPANPLNKNLIPSERDSAWIFVDTINQIDPNSYVTDIAGNRQIIKTNRKVPLVIKERPIDFKVLKLDLIGEDKGLIPDALKIGHITNGTVLVLTLGNTGSISIESFIKKIENGKITAAVYDLVANEVIKTSNNDYNPHLLIDVKTYANKPAVVLNWDAKNSNDREVSTGAYIIIVEISGADILNTSVLEKWNIKQYK